MAHLYKDPNGIGIFKPGSDKSCDLPAAEGNNDEITAIEYQISQLELKLAEVSFFYLLLQP